MSSASLRTICKVGNTLTPAELQAIYAIRAEYMRPKNSKEQDWAYFSEHIAAAQYLFLFVDADEQIQGCSLVYHFVGEQNGQPYLGIELGLGYLRPQYRSQGYPNSALTYALTTIYAEYPDLPKYFLGVAFPAGYLIFRPFGLPVFHLESPELTDVAREILRTYSLSQYGDGISPVCNSILVPIASEAEISRYAAHPDLQTFMQLVPHWYEGFALFIIVPMPKNLV
jgi:hypothetical protein